MSHGVGNLGYVNSQSRWIGAAFVTVVAALGLSACSTGSNPSTSATVTQTVTSSAAPRTSESSSAPVAPVSTTQAAPTKAVHLSSLENDGTTWGVGMPIIIYAKPAPTDSTEFTKNVTVTVDGQPAGGEWFWSQPDSTEVKNHIMEAHYRPRTYWPANSTIEVKLPLAGLSAGPGLAYDGKLTSISIMTGDSHVSMVDSNTESMTVTKNNKVVKTIPVSLGAGATPTYNGTKVVMQKGEALDPATDAEKLRPNGAVIMDGPGYHELVDWSVRVTNSGEYVHAAPWNSRIGQASTSHGCTNLATADAKWFYDFSLVGDPIEYKNTTGGKMPSWDGYGDWNIPWALWAKGGKLINHSNATGSSTDSSSAHRLSRRTDSS